MINDEKPGKSTAISKVKHRYGNSVARLQCVHIYTSVHLYISYPAEKHQNTANLGLQGKPVDLFMIPHGRHI